MLSNIWVVEIFQTLSLKFVPIKISFIRFFVMRKRKKKQKISLSTFPILNYYIKMYHYTTLCIFVQIFCNFLRNTVHRL